MLIEIINYFNWIRSSWVRHSYFKSLYYSWLLVRLPRDQQHPSARFSICVELLRKSATWLFL